MIIREDADGRDEERAGLFAGSDPFDIAMRWQKAAWDVEVNDANAMALATVDGDGLPNVRVVLLKDIEGFDTSEQPGGGFVFYTNRDSAKGQNLAAIAKAAGVLHWKSVRQQVRFRGPVEIVGDAQSDAYFATRHPQSRAGAIASQQSRPLASRQAMLDETAAVAEATGGDPKRPANWGGYRIRPVEIEFWAEGDHRIHDRFRWTRDTPSSSEWIVKRLYP